MLDQGHYDTILSMAGMCECPYYCDAAADHADVYAKRRYQGPFESSGSFI